MTDSLRLEVSEFGIHPIIVEPGGIATEWGAIAAGNLQKTSGGGAYSTRAKRTAERMAAMYSSGRLSSAELIGKNYRESGDGKTSENTVRGRFALPGYHCSCADG